MVATEFLQQLDRLKFVEAVGLDDFADKCSYMLSFVVLIMCFTIVAIKSYVLDPFVCYLPTTISGSNYVPFVNAFCWINGTVPANSIDNRFDYQQKWEELEPHKMNYYQWVALVLALQAMLCYLPHLIWEAITFNRVGTNLGFLIETAQAASKEVDKSRKNKINFIAKSLDTLLFARRPLRSRYEDFPQDKPMYRTIYDTVFSCFPKKRLGSALAFYYIFIKFLYLGNAVVQLVIMERFLGVKNSKGFFGLTVLNSVLSGNHWNETRIFPRVGFCRVPVKITHSDVKHFIVQCSLPINMLNEKIYIFLWFWFMFIAALEIIAISIWVMRLIVKKNRVQLLVRYFTIADAFDNDSKAMLPKFEESVLRQDGCFVLHMIKLNAGEIVAYEVLQAMYKIYIDNNPEELKEISAPPENLSYDEKLHSSSTIDKRFDEKIMQ